MTAVAALAAMVLAVQRAPILKSRLPCVGYVTSAQRELLVIGTAHTPCRSAEEVDAVISKAKPDVVVVELDQERLEGLMRNNFATSAQRQYGEDFAAAVSAAAAVDAPIVLGDAKARDTLAALRAPGPIADSARIARALDLALRSVGRDAVTKQPVSVLGSLVDDAGKLLPLLAGLWFAVALSALTMVVLPAASSSSPLALEAIASTTLSVTGVAAILAVSVRAADVVLLSRDEVLASSTLSGLELAAGLKSGQLLRRRYRFSTVPSVLAAAPLPPPDALPFFTLRKPLARGETRRLNLFEPRWLSLLDTLAASHAPDQADTADGLVGATFGCVFAANRFYAPAGDGWDGDGARTADVVLRPLARRARVVRAEASTRPVSGARRLEVWIVGEEPLRINADSLCASDRGYLMGKVLPCTEDEYANGRCLEPEAPSWGGSGSASASGTPPSRPVRVVSVVGLAHANGVLDRCAALDLRDDQSLSVDTTREPDWVGY
jgi:hypothetical protein